MIACNEDTAVRSGPAHFEARPDRPGQTPSFDSPREIAVDGEIGITAATLQGFHGDPADRLITSTALVRGDRLLTADGKILDWEGVVQRQDARR